MTWLFTLPYGNDNVGMNSEVYLHKQYFISHTKMSSGVNYVLLIDEKIFLDCIVSMLLD